jgi:O-antigen/teichoic acid export membrane protein
MRESLPLAGVVLFSTAMARFDWIFIGLFVSAAKLAEYSFAYKGFEVASLPLQALAPLLLPAFARRLGAAPAAPAPAATPAAPAAAPAAHDPRLQRLLTIELCTAWGIFLLMNLLWSPWVDALTQGRYGHVNARTVFWLSLVLPVYFMNNFLWTIHFALGRLTWIFKAFVVGFVLNVAGDIILIPLYGNEGAAVAYLLAMLVQTLLYHKGIREVSLTRAWVTLLAGGALAGLLLWAATR